jgi:DegV family protein with EDD domain
MRAHRPHSRGTFTARVRIITNPGSNLSPAAIERYRIQVMPQQIIVDGDAFDTRGGVTAEAIDQWVRTAKQHPHVVGTTAAELMVAYRAAAKDDRDLLVVMTSRKIIGSHDAAQIAAKTLLEQPASAGLRVHVADTGVTDVGAGLACVLAAEAHRAGLGLDEIGDLLERYRQTVQMAISVEQFDYLVKGGRASSVRAFLGNLLGVRPIIGFEQGEIGVLEKISAKADAGKEVVNLLEKRLGRGRRIWAGVFHGRAPERATAVADELRRRFDVAMLWTRPLAPSIYLHCGPGSVGVAAVPLDALPFAPSVIDPL